MKKSSFDFKQNVTNMLHGMGARTSDYGGYSLELDTRAGLLRCQVHDDWLAARFDDPKAAASVIAGGSLNRFSGKWNWHYTKPVQQDVLEVARHLAQVIIGEKDLQRVIRESSRKENTLFNYGYRDASNYKTNNRVVLAGRLSTSDLKIIIACCDRVDDIHFIPGQVNLLDLQDSFAGCQSEWDDERDHPWHELLSVELVDSEPSGELSVTDLVNAFVRVAAEGGWDEKHKPEFYDAMKERHDRRVASEGTV